MFSPTSSLCVCSHLSSYKCDTKYILFCLLQSIFFQDVLHLTEHTCTFVRIVLFGVCMVVYHWSVTGLRVVEICNRWMHSSRHTHAQWNAKHSDCSHQSKVQILASFCVCVCVSACESYVRMFNPNKQPRIISLCMCVSVQINQLRCLFLFVY